MLCTYIIIWPYMNTVNTQMYYHEFFIIRFRMNIYYSCMSILWTNYFCLCTTKTNSIYCQFRSETMFILQQNMNCYKVSIFCSFFNVDLGKSDVQFYSSRSTRGRKLVFSSFRRTNFKMWCSVLSWYKCRRQHESGPTWPHQGMNIQCCAKAEYLAVYNGPITPDLVLKDQEL